MGIFLILAMSFFNISCKLHLRKILKKDINDYIISIVPIILAFLFSAFFPDIIRFLEYNGVVACLTNGFIYPILIKIAILKK